jgi:hypothetical protein
MKLRGIPIGLATLKDGKLKPVKKYRSASDKIRERTSKKVRVKKMGGS